MEFTCRFDVHREDELSEGDVFQVIKTEIHPHWVVATIQKMSFARQIVEVPAVAMFWGGLILGIIFGIYISNI